MKKRLALIVRAALSAVHVLFVKILNIKSLHASAVQDFALTTRIFPHDGGTITLEKHIHARKNTVFEAEGGSIEIGEGCFFNNGSMIVSKESIKIGAYTCFGPNVLVYDHDHDIKNGKNIHDSGYKTAPVIIGKNVWIGANSVILRGTVIGDGSIVGAGSVIKGTYGADSVIIQKRGEESVTKRAGKDVAELV